MGGGLIITINVCCGFFHFELLQGADIEDVRRTAWSWDGNPLGYRGSKLFCFCTLRGKCSNEYYNTHAQIRKSSERCRWSSATG